MPQTGKAAELQQVNLAQTGEAAELEQVNADGQISICAKYANEFNTVLSVTNGTANMTVRVLGIVGVTTKIHTKVALQKYSDGKWSTIKTYEETVESYIYSMKKTKAVSKGKYRMKGVYTVYKGAKSEKTTKYSKTVSYS